LRVAESGEFGLLRELERRGLVTGIGDDVAVLPNGLVATTDILLEDVHFRLAWLRWRDLGYKAAAVNLSDLAAAGAAPVGLLVALGVPPSTPVEEVAELYAGLAETGVPVLGGDTTRAESVVVSVTALGRSDRVPGRAGARPGDELVVTGPLGGAAAGLRALERGQEGVDDLVERHRRPPFRLEEGRALAPVAHALVDLSDGIASDAARIAERSGCRVVVDVDRLPLAPGLDRAGDESFWTAGEDYELLAVLAPSDAAASGFPVVGRCEAGEGVELRLGGERLDLAGWDHFRS